MSGLAMTTSQVRTKFVRGLDLSMISFSRGNINVL